MLIDPLMPLGANRYVERAGAQQVIASDEFLESGPGTPKSVRCSVAVAALSHPSGRILALLTIGCRSILSRISARVPMVTVPI
jgi:hypothetical protein